MVHNSLVLVLALVLALVLRVSSSMFLSYFPYVGEHLSIFCRPVSVCGQVPQTLFLNAIAACVCVCVCVCMCVCVCVVCVCVHVWYGVQVCEKCMCVYVERGKGSGMSGV